MKNTKKTKMKISGKPHQTPRQRAWLKIRELGEFTIQEVASAAKMKYESTREFVSCLKKAGIVDLTDAEPLHHENCVVKQKYFKLVKDCGYTVPKVTSTGRIIVEMTGTKAMWNTLRITRTAMTYEELAVLSSNDEIKISALTAREYTRALHDAGYLAITQDSSTAGIGKKRKYLLIHEMNTGPNPPQIQRTKQVFDPNISKVVYRDQPELEEELKEGLLA